MFRNYTIACLLLLILCASSGTALAKPRTAILEFEDKSGAGAPGEAVADMLTTELFSTNEFTVLERQRLDAVLSEQGLVSDGFVDGATAAKMGELLCVDFLITGAIIQFTTETAGGVVPLAIGSFGGVAVGTHTVYVTLDVRAVSTTAGEILLAARELGGGQRHSGRSGRLRRRFRPRQDRRSAGVKVGRYLEAFKDGKVLEDMQENVLDAEKIYTAVLVVRKIRRKGSQKSPPDCTGGLFAFGTAYEMARVVFPPPWAPPR